MSNELEQKKSLGKFFKKMDKNVQKIKKGLAAIDAEFSNLMEAEEEAPSEVKISNGLSPNPSST